MPFIDVEMMARQHIMNLFSSSSSKYDPGARVLGRNPFLSAKRTSEWAEKCVS